MMGTSAFDTMSGYKQQLAALESRLAAARAEFLDAVGIFLKQWFQEQTRQAFQSRPEVAKAQGPELQTDLAELLGAVPHMVQEEFTRTKYWSHLYNDFRSNRYRLSGRRLPGKFEHGLLLLMGRLGDLLVRHGFDDPSAWKRRSGRTEVYYSKPFEPSREVRTGLERYADLYDHWNRVSRELEAAKKSTT